MTLEELQRLSDSELIEKVATEVMGWHEDKGGHCSMCRPWLDGDSKIQGWKFVCSEDGHDCWDPLEDWNHTMEVVKKITETHQFELFSNFQFGWAARFTRPRLLHGKTFEEINDDPKCAICLAALLTVVK